MSRIWPPNAAKSKLPAIYQTVSEEVLSEGHPLIRPSGLYIFSPPHAGLGCKLQHIGNVDVLKMPRIGIRRPPRRGLPSSTAHPHPAVPDDPENVRQVRIVEEYVPHLMSEGGSYRFAPVTDISTVREATTPEVHADKLVLSTVDRGVHIVGVREGLRRELCLHPVYGARHVGAKVEVRWVIRDVRSADRPRLTGGWCWVSKLEGSDLGLAYLTLFLDDTLEFFFRGGLYLVRNYVDRLGNFFRLGLIGPIDRGILQRQIVPLAN